MLAGDGLDSDQARGPRHPGPRLGRTFTCSQNKRTSEPTALAGPKPGPEQPIPVAFTWSHRREVLGQALSAHLTLT